MGFIEKKKDTENLLQHITAFIYNQMIFFFLNNLFAPSEKVTIN